MNLPPEEQAKELAFWMAYAHFGPHSKECYHQAVEHLFAGRKALEVLWQIRNGIPPQAIGMSREALVSLLEDPNLPQSEVELVCEIIDRQNTEVRWPSGVKRPVMTRLGSIYLGRSTTHSFTKIGFSIKPALRERTLQAQDSGFTLIFISPPKWIYADEQRIHEDHKEHRKRGEWFALSEEQISRLKKELA